ncbi:MAG: MaoC family dehydratase [Paracoccaceae bacterium]
MFFDDFAQGQRFQTGSRTITEAEIIAFAGEWDPQSFHTDPAAAASSSYGGIIASGFHTLLVAFRLVLEADVWTEASQGGPGIEDLRWLKPVRPGDTLSVEMEVTAVRPSSRLEDRGYVTLEYTILRQGEEVVATWRAAVILLKRPQP